MPQRYREPVVLCYLEGLTSEQAAARIGCPPGTVFSRLSRARVQWRGSLVRRGVAMPTASLAVAFTPVARGAVPPSLLDTTVRASIDFAARRAPELGLASAPAVTLARGVLYAMAVSRLKILGAASVACVLALGGASAALAQAVDRTRPQQPAPAVTDDGTADKAKKARLKELMEKAITAYAKGNYLESETLAKRAMEVDPNEPAAPMLVFKARTERRFKQDLQNSDAVLSRSVDQLSANWTNRPAGTPRCRIMSAQSGPSSRRQAPAGRQATPRERSSNSRMCSSSRKPRPSTCLLVFSSALSRSDAG